MIEVVALSYLSIGLLCWSVMEHLQKIKVESTNPVIYVVSRFFIIPLFMVAVLPAFFWCLAVGSIVTSRWSTPSTEYAFLYLIFSAMMFLIFYHVIY